MLVNLKINDCFQMKYVSRQKILYCYCLLESSSKLIDHYRLKYIYKDFFYFIIVFYIEQSMKYWLNLVKSGNLQCIFFVLIKKEMKS